MMLVWPVLLSMGFLRLSFIRWLRLKQLSDPWITHEILELIKEREIQFILEFKRSNQKVLMNNFVKLEIWYKIKWKKLKN